ncbi:hypothetical protein Smp_138410 [Schistosoma mansoni]|nr:hypothetical protein Smp_138410 [Schistosoma mansoni]|eukprot:XP_018645602.1 hypothetical protein Smp_138410 [Schistosoma mansoni]
MNFGRNSSIFKSIPWATNCRIAFSIALKTEDTSVPYKK